MTRSDVVSRVDAEFWQQTPAGVAPVIDPAAGDAGSFGRRPVTTPAEVSGVAERTGATEFDVLLAVFVVLVARWNGRRDPVVIGSVRGVALRIQVPGADTSFAALVRQVHETVEAAAAHDDLRSHVDDAPATDDLAFVLEPGGGHLEYRTDVFGPAEIESMAGGFEHLCAQVVTDPFARLWQLDALAPGQWQDLVHHRNDTATDYPFAASCLHELVEQRVDDCPDRIAVVCGRRRLTYRELDLAANRLAHHLRARGVGPEVPVCVLLDRSIELLVGLLAVLKAGGAYVPLEPSYPAARLAFMAEETAAPVLLTRSDLVARAPEGDWEIVSMDTDRDRIGRMPARRPAVDVTPDNLAYVIYTSGSTGRPKGVMAHHRGVVHYLAWCGWAYRADEGDGAPVHSPLSFDLTVTGLFLPLLYGRSVTLIPEGGHPVVDLAAELGAGADFTFVKLTPGHLNVLAQCLPDPVTESAAAARWLVVGGEQLTAEHVACWREHAPDVMVANEYGHTETSVACVMECRPVAELTSSPVSIGRPFWNTQLYVVDDELNLVPPGVPGELLTGGVGVTRGYFGRPALTAEKFVPNPFGPGRLYRSGDIVRYLPDGRLEFVSRIDRQVKVRGFRVELGEIEAGIAAFPGVRQAVVLLRPDERGTPRLVAYVESAAPVSTVDLTAFLRARLPDYMVPEQVVRRDAFPLTANGKIDHERLSGGDPR